MELQPKTQLASRPPTEREAFRPRLASLQGRNVESAGSGTKYLALMADFHRLSLPSMRALLCTPLAWTDEEKLEARWLNHACDDLAALGYRLSLAAARDPGLGDETARAVLGATLYFMGETVKWDVAVSRSAPHDLRKPHALMRLAMDAGHRESPARVRAGGSDAQCTLESLYFRVLLLARFASGALNPKQIEILDAWMWIWAPVLRGVSEPPPGAALRADLDSASGLQRGPRRGGDGLSLYLPQAPIETAYRAVIAEFHAGRIVPAEGIASEFRIEEHVAVLDLIRRGMEQSKLNPAARAERRSASRTLQMHVGLAEIMGRGFAPAAPVASTVTLAAVDGRRSTGSRREQERDTALGDIYDAKERIVQLIDESDTGFGIEGTAADCGAIVTGDLVGIRLSADEPLVIGSVVRRAPSRTAGRVFLGVRRISAAVQVVDARRERAGRSADTSALMFVSGSDASGRDDACLVSERDFTERSAIAAQADGMVFTFRLNRVRDRGCGWVLAGLEVVSARPHVDYIVA